MKKLSIIVPVYNAQKHIRKCLDSICVQLCREYELLLIDDGSQDGSLEIIEEYKQKFPDMIRVISKQNEGAAKTRNLGIHEAKGKYLCFIDNDDFVDRDYFSTFLNAIEKSGSDIVLGGYRRVEEDRIRFQVNPKMSKWYKFTVVAPWARILKKSFLLEQGIEFLEYGLGEDVYFSVMAYARTEKVEIIDYVGYNWYFNEKSVSNTSQKGISRELDPLYLLGKIYDKIGKGDRLFSYYYIRYGVWYLLFSGRRATQEEFITEYHRIFTWYRERGIPEKFPIFSRDIFGEKMAIRCIINFFLILRKFKMVKIFSNFYCIGE